MPHINSEKDSLSIEHHNDITRVRFMITSTKICIVVANLSISDNIKLLEILKQKFTKTIFWNKHRSEITAQPKK